MNKRLVDLIVYLVSSCSSLPRTNLVKLLYLEELLDVAYSTPPMKYTSRGEVIDFAKFRVNKKADDLRNRARARMASFHTRKLTSEDAAIRAKDLEPLIALQYYVISNQH